MNKTINAPRSLVEAVRYFANKEVALTFLASLRWPDGVTCPHCSGREHSFLKTRQIWKCKGCKKQFSVKVGTIFEDSPIGLDKWLPALWLLANAKNGISSYELARSLGVTQKSAWFMLHRIRLAMQTQTFSKLTGEVEIDETLIGGKAKNMHRKERANFHNRPGPMGKTAVVGAMQRTDGTKASRIRLKVVPNLRGHRLKKFVRDNVEPGTQLYSDTMQAYRGIEETHPREMVNHIALEYVRGKVHTNGIENFWSLLKRTIRGTYVSVDPVHLFRYLDEQAHRFNFRKTKDGSRFIDTVAGIIGKRLTYSELIGADATT